MSAILLNRLRKLQQGLEQRRAAMRARRPRGQMGFCPFVAHVQCATRAGTKVELRKSPVFRSGFRRD